MSRVKLGGASFVVGETFVPTECRLDEGHTSKPSLLTEADLVSLMDENGIGMLLHLCNG